jgi:Uma2 family endonuclease
MGSPVRIGHGKIHACIMAWLGNYWTATPGVQVADNTTVRLDGDNEPQPDALLRIEKNGRSQIRSDGYIEGSPERIVEIAIAFLFGVWIGKLDSNHAGSDRDFIHPSKSAAKFPHQTIP